MKLDLSIGLWIAFNLTALIYSVFNIRDARKDELARIRERKDGQIALVTQFSISSEIIWLFPIFGGLGVGLLAAFPSFLQGTGIRSLAILALIETLPLFMLVQSILRRRYRHRLINYSTHETESPVNNKEVEP